MEAITGILPERSFWKDKRVLVTGHTGFKGSWLTHWLEELGAEVCGLALDPISVGEVVSKVQQLPQPAGSLRLSETSEPNEYKESEFLLLHSILAKDDGKRDLLL